MPTLGKVRKERGDRWYIELPGKIKIFCDKDHKTFYSRQHAEFTLAQIYGENVNGTFDPDFYSKRRKSILSFSVYADQWFELCEKRRHAGKLSGGHLNHIKQYIKNYFKPFFQDMNILDIRGSHIEDFYLSLERAPKTVWNIMGSLHKLFQDAVDREVIPSLPHWPQDLNWTELPDPEWKWADEETQEKIFAELDPEHLFFILFQAAHGTRTGETRALQHDDIDLENDVVTIARAFSGKELKTTKTKRTRRLPLDPVWKELYLSRPIAFDRKSFVFMKDGKPYHENYMYYKWVKACERAGVPEISLYAGTRHSIASQAANRGASLYAISKFLGHTNTNITQRYAHLDTASLVTVQRKSAVHALFRKQAANGQSDD